MIFLVVFIDILGIILLTISVVNEATDSHPNKQANLSLIIIGSILVIPGFYYLYRIIKVIIYIYI